MLNLVLFGPPGAGKGTQANLLIDRYNLLHLSTGDLLRAEIADQTKLGLEAKALMDAGNLVPDEVVIGMIENKIENNPNINGFIFDGFPRTKAQAIALDDLLENKNIPITPTEIGRISKKRESLSVKIPRSKYPIITDSVIENNNCDDSCSPRNATSLSHGFIQRP